MSKEPSLPMSTIPCKTREQEQKNGKESSVGNHGHVERRRRRREAVLSAPLKLEGSPDGGNYRAPNVIQRVFCLIKGLRPGTDLTRFQVPPIFHIPKSMIQLYGESVFCFSKDILSQFANGTSSVDRFISAVAWNISTMRPLIFGLGPYNPILGETHHVSKGTLNVLVEQVSHHPPVSAIHVTDDKDGIEIVGCHPVVPKFHGTYAEIQVHGRRQLRHLNEGENYVMEHPNLVVRFLPVPGVHWLGDITVHCPETGLQADLHFGGDSFLGQKSKYGSIKGRIFMSSSMETIYEINGHWDRVVTVKDFSNGEHRVIYNAKESLSGLKTPTVKDPEELLPSESAVVWAEVSQSILSRCWEQAKVAKTALEERERLLAREREARGETWVPKHFTVSYSKESGWTCSPNKKLVPPAPIVVPV